VFLFYFYYCRCLLRSAKKGYCIWHLGTVSQTFVAKQGVFRIEQVFSNAQLLPTLIKKKIKFSFYIRKFRSGAKSFMTNSNGFLIYEFAPDLI
jgi:hypothetical protein